MKTRNLIIILATTFLVGLFMGRKTISSDPVVKYVKGDTITDSIPYPEPYEVVVPKYVTLPREVDTLFINGDTIYRDGDVDTSAIIADYIVKRFYKEQLFDSDTLGNLAISAQVQYNKLSGLSYTFVPITKETTYTVKKKYVPFITASYNTMNYFGVGGGMYFNNFGMSLKYYNTRDFNNKAYEVGLYRKFN